MDDSSQTLTITNAPVNHSFNYAEDEQEEEFCDLEAWDTLSKSFSEVQSVLDHNRRLIQQVNDNHRSKIPHNLAENVSLIREINANISKVIGLYSNLSVNFSGIVQQRRATAADKAAKNIGSWSNISVYSFALEVRFQL